MSDKSKAGFEGTIAQLLAASPKNSSKADPVKAWIQATFNLSASVARITEDKQLGNRITEQFAHQEPVVVFVLEHGVNCGSLASKVSQRRYPKLESVLLMRNKSGGVLTYEKLLIKKASAFSLWAEQTLGISAEMFAGSLQVGPPEIDGPWQRITYGAPGTGKSFGTEGELVDDNGNEKAISFRTTFHPDSDYSTFVGAYKPTMNEVGGAQKIVYAFRPQAFTNAYVAAWKEMAKGSAGKPVVLVVEEINRGNCAQIFGDLFQLLDRDDNGWSTYPIDADADLAKWLASDEKDEDQQLVGFGSDGLGLAKPTDATFKMKQSDWDAVMTGKKLALPPNLYIWATMNTSDQSLFPIDSAFKRRWDWKYVPIAKPDKTGDVNWKERKIVVNGKLYDWWAFITSINAQIADITKSEDKQLGYFFVKAPDATGLITAEQFANKVLFYLFNDVFRDWDLPAAIFGKGTGKDKYAFKDFFYAVKTDNFKPGDVREDVVAAFIEKQKDENGQPLAGVDLTPPAGTPPPAPAPSTVTAT